MMHHRPCACVRPPCSLLCGGTSGEGAVVCLWGRRPGPPPNTRQFGDAVEEPESDGPKVMAVNPPTEHWALRATLRGHELGE